MIVLELHIIHMMDIRRQEEGMQPCNEENDACALQ